MYLENRHQLVDFINHLSTLLNVIFGVFQEASAGPLLFSIYMNGVSTVLDSETILFSDDTLFLTSRILLQASLPLNAHFLRPNNGSQITIWFLSKDKTRMLFHNSVNIEGNLESVRFFQYIIPI